jgi:hypothetical protein
MYLKEMSGGSTPVQFRELAVMGTPSSIGGNAGAIATTPITVSTGMTETQPLDCLHNRRALRRIQSPAG